VATLDPTVMSAFWSRSGHRLFVVRVGTFAGQSWTPEAGMSNLAGAHVWSFLPGMSPDASRVACTAYADPSTFQNLRVYTYDLKAASTRLLINKLRTQLIFVKDGWV
jgi:hypothetical protein